MKLDKTQIQLRKRILDISYKHSLSHLGSCLSAVDIIEAVYQVKEKADRFVLSGGHAGIALYAVLERRGFKIDMSKLGIHPDRASMIDVSTGSLGQGLPIAVGLALANRNRKVYCEITDSECSEGSIWEALRIGYEQNLTNLIVLVNSNGFSALTALNSTLIKRRIIGFKWKLIALNGHNLSNLKKALRQKKNTPTLIFAKTKVNQFPFLQSIDAHYHTLTEQEYKYSISRLGGGNG